MTETDIPNATPPGEAPVSILAVANALIELGLGRDFRARDPMTHMRIQKLSYCAYGHYLARHGRRMTDAQPEIWTQGPSFRDLYLALQYAGKDPVTNPITLPLCETRLTRCSDVEGIVVLVEAQYKRTSTLDLAALAHGPDSAWYRAAQDLGFRCRAGTKIPDALITAQFAALPLP